MTDWQPDFRSIITRRDDDLLEGLALLIADAARYRFISHQFGKLSAGQTKTFLESIEIPWPGGSGPLGTWSSHHNDWSLDKLIDNRLKEST